ncbi:MAG: thioredoxin fold domain-containing protein [Flavobacteriales bacterium]|jgi:thioredoxin|nr:thioredoxin fold domain-containing protein [Flavobacteriales bacterium]
MTKLLAFLLAPSLLLFGCSSGQTQDVGHGKASGGSLVISKQLNAQEFQQKIKELPKATLLDVRTPQEFANGHLAHALNWDWNNREFKKQVAQLDKTEPLLVYCLSGGRSGAAMKALERNGFQEVYELKGGIMKWRSAGLPETTGTATATSGMTKAEFDALTANDKVVLVDFYADWCAPCKRMKPYLDEISKDMADRVVVVRIDADANSELCKAMGVDALPVLHVYKNKQLTWQNTGYIGKERVVAQL